MSITGNRVEFKSLEEKVFAYVCKCGREIIVYSLPIDNVIGLSD